MRFIDDEYLKKPWLLSVCLIAVTIYAFPSAAKGQTVTQTADAQTASATTGLEEITVTARKKSESALEVPVAFTAFDSTAIAEQGITNINDIANVTPGFTILNQSSSRNDRSNQTLILRGMAPASNLLAPTGSVFIDGAPVTSGYVEGIDAVDRVEVLKGPQSAYFGRSAFSGAINVVTKKPSDTLKLGIDALGGSDNWFDVRGTAEGPIIEDKLGMRVSIRDYHRTGQYTNHGNEGGTLGDQSTQSINSTIYMTPIDDLKINLFGNYWHDHDGPGATGVLLAKDYNCNAGAAPKGTNNYFCGQLPSIANSRLAADTLIDPTLQYLINNPPGRTALGPSQGTDHGGLSRDAWHVHLDWDYAIPSWGITLSSISAANQDHYETIQDLDNQASTTGNFPNPAYKGPTSPPTVEPYQNWIFIIGLLQDDISQEFRITSDQDQPFRWAFGVNYAYEVYKSAIKDNSPSNPADFGEPQPTLSSTYSAFGNLGYDVMKDLTISFDARYQLDHQENYAEQLTGPDTFVASLNNRTFSPRVIVEYHITPDIMTYASWSVGNNTGGLANATYATLAAFKKAELPGGINLFVQPEKTEQYEVGIKGRFWDRRISLSTDLYGGTWTNQIVQSGYTVGAFPGPVVPGNQTTVQFYGNVGKTDLFGWEFDGRIKPIDHLIINANAGMAGTDLRSYSCTVCAGYTGTTNVKGNQLPYYPKWQANIGAEWSDDLKLLEGFTYYGRADVTYKDIMFTDDTNLAWTPSSMRYNFRLGIASESYTLEAFVLNAFNDKAYVNAQESSDLLGGFVPDTPVGLPILRQFGVRFKYLFDGGATSSADYTAPPTPMPAPAPTPAPAPVAAAPEAARSFQVFFDFDKSDITSAAAQVIQAAADSVKAGNVVQITVTGHTDTVGAAAYNQALSERRAAAVKAGLVADGVGGGEITTIGVGKTGLLVPTGDGVREPQNRRAEIVLK